jgi:hypothetical protein
MGGLLALPPGTTAIPPSGRHALIAPNGGQSKGRRPRTVEKRQAAIYSFRQQRRRTVIDR